MKKILLSICLILVFSICAFAQLRKTVALDSVVSVTLPSDFKKLDTLGQQNYTANSEYGYIIVNKSPNPANKTLTKEKELNQVFKEYISKIQAGLPDGRVINDHDTVVNKMEVRDFTLATDTGSGVQLRKFRVLYTQPATYTFQYLYDDMRKEVAVKEGDDFFKSIAVAEGVDGTDQYTNFGKETGPSTIVKIAAIGGFALIVVLIILFIRRKQNSDMLINDAMNKR